jgi:uncharacterized protein YjcR
MTEETCSEAEEIRLAIEHERASQMAKRSHLRGCKLSKTLRERAQRHAQTRLDAGCPSTEIARDLGLAVGTLENWMRRQPGAPTSDDEAAEARAIRSQIEEARRGRTQLRGQRLAEALRRRAQEHARTRAAAGAKLKRIAEEMGVTVSTLQQWMRPAPADGPVKLRPVRIIGPINSGVAELTGPRLVLPSGVQIVGLDVDQMTTLMKRLG